MQKRCGGGLESRCIQEDSGAPSPRALLESSQPGTLIRSRTLLTFVNCYDLSSKLDTHREQRSHRIRCSWRGPKCGIDQVGRDTQTSERPYVTRFGTSAGGGSAVQQRTASTLHCHLRASCGLEYCWLAHSMCARAIARRTTRCVRREDQVRGFVGRYSTSMPLPEANSTSASRPIDPRWLSDVKQRVGKCITFGLSSKQTDEAGSILQQLASDWIELVAGSEGYLTAPGRVGLDRQAVVWGEMVLLLHSVHASFG